MRTYCIILVFLISKIVCSQGIQAYLDNRDYLMVFEDGVEKQLEFLKVQSFKVGSDYVAYTDNNNRFKIYHNGEIAFQQGSAVDEYWTTNHLLVYKMAGKLGVFDEGKNHDLAYMTTKYSYGDSVVAFLDHATTSFKVYYNGEITTLGFGDGYQRVTSFRAGGNTVVYVGADERLKAFYQKKTYELTQDKTFEYKPGTDVIAFYNNFNQEFNVFQKGEITNLENFKPQSYEVGNNVVAYVDNLETFKVYYNGESTELTSIKPTFYYVKDELVVYSDGFSFNVFFRGKVYELENFVPTTFTAERNVLVYLGSNNRLRMFDGITQITVTQEQVDDFDLNWKTIRYRVGPTVKIYYEGKVY